eukprot:15447743-Alexandrium_andersonii.AAC.1
MAAPVAATNAASRDGAGPRATPSSMGGGGGNAAGRVGSPPSGRVLKMVMCASAPRPVTRNRGCPDFQCRFRHAAAV